MSEPVQSFNYLATVPEILKKLIKYPQISNYPVINNQGYLLGTISKKIIIILLEKECFYKDKTTLVDITNLEGSLEKIPSLGSFFHKRHVSINVKPVVDSFESDDEDI